MTIIETHRAARALQHCREVTRRRARNFYYGLKLLPEPQRSALFAVYAWMRRADDLVDDATSADNARRRLEAFRQATDEALRGRPVGYDAVLVGLREAATRFSVDPKHFHAMLDGQLSDLAGRRYETFDDLRAYCEQVASAVGLVCIEIWGSHDPRAPQLGIERGIAFQLTNILRDFAEDYDAGRVYLPGEEFRRWELDPATLRGWTDPKRCHGFMMDQIDRAERFYERSRPLDGMIEPRCLPTLWAMTAIYHRLLEKLRHDPSQTASDAQVRLGPMLKGAIAIGARVRAWGGARSAARKPAGGAPRDGGSPPT